MSSMSMINGYGIEVSDLVDLLDVEKVRSRMVRTDESIETSEDLYNVEYSELVDDPDVILIGGYGDDVGNCLYIPTLLPYQKSWFNSKEECDKYFYKAVLPILKESVSFSQFSKILDEILDYIYC